MKIGQLHESLKAIAFIIGKWKSISARTLQPTTNKFSYSEELSFSSLGQPLLNYTSVSWNSINKEPMQLESGYLLIKPGTNELALVIATNTGAADLEEGHVEGGEIHLRTSKILSMPFAQGPQIREIRRHYKFDEDRNELDLIVGISTSRVSYADHLHITYKKWDGRLEALNAAVHKF